MQTTTQKQVEKNAQKYTWHAAVVTTQFNLKVFDEKNTHNILLKHMQVTYLLLPKTNFAWHWSKK